MNLFLFVTFVVSPVFLFSSEGVAAAKVEDAADSSYAAFERFMHKHQKKYPTKQELQQRYDVFRKNMKFAQTLQKHELGTAKYGATKFADLTKEEFAKMNPILRQKPELRPKQAEIPLVDGPLPANFDWRKKGAVTPVKNQGSCGSCWAFSTTGNIEGVWFVKKGKLVSLSEQQLVDCDKVDQGCNGGLPSQAYEAIEKMGGMEAEGAYPYVGEDEKCTFSLRQATVFINSSVSISRNETEMAMYLLKHGPLSIGINAMAMQFYFGGISHPWKIFCWPSQLDHGVLIVGYGVEGSTPYWIVKNSWGEDWGEHGYYRVYRGDGTCGLNTMVTSSIVD